MTRRTVLHAQTVHQASPWLWYGRDARRGMKESKDLSPRSTILCAAASLIMPSLGAGLRRSQSPQTAFLDYRSHRTSVINFARYLMWNTSIEHSLQHGW